MKVLIDKSLEKDIDKIKDKKLFNSIADIIEKTEQTDKLDHLPNCKKLKGFKNAYRIRIGDYRIGFIFENKTITFIRCLHRNKIYDYFPD